MDMSKVVSNKDSFLRFGYAKGFAYGETSDKVSNAYIGASNNNLKDTNVFGVFFDTTVPLVKHSLVQLSYSKIKDIIANQLDSNFSENKNLGNVDMYGAMIEITDLKKSNVDLFLHYGYIKTDPNTNTYLDYGGLLSSSEDTRSKSGSSLWLGGRYGFGDKHKYKLGLEYNHGSKNWISLTQGAFDICNKLSTRGDVYEAYIMYEINRYANIRLGYIDINYDYTKSGWFVGEGETIDTQEDMLKRLQSVYLKMSVKY
jgi:hypothetical protein